MRRPVLPLLALTVIVASPGVPAAEDPETVFGPVTVAREGDARTAARWALPADPGLRYALEVAWPAAPAAVPPVSVRLNEHHVMRQRTPGRTRRVVETVPLGRENRLELVLAGERGASVSVTVRAWPAALPADPGPAGRASLEGVDADGDGLRDDLQRYIAGEHPRSARLRLALTSYARAMQDALVDAADQQASLDHARRMSRLIDCVHGLVGYKARAINRRLVGRVTDTRARQLAYARFRRQIHAQTFVATPLRRWKAACPFDPDQVAD